MEMEIFEVAVHDDIRTQFSAFRTNRRDAIALNVRVDVMRCFATAAIDQHERPGKRAGALRLRLVAVSEANPADEPDFPLRLKDDKGRERYNPRVLLDMDFWELMPRRAG